MITTTTRPALGSTRLTRLRRFRVVPGLAGSSVRLSVLIPAFNVAPVLEETVRTTVENLSGLGISFEVVIANDGSTDRTAAIIDELCSSLHQVKAVRLRRNRGKGEAVRAAFEASRGKYVLFMDADGATSLEAIPVFLDAVRDRADLVIASRHHPESQMPVPQPWHRRLMGLVMRNVVRCVTGLPHKDTQCGFKMFRREVAAEIFRRQQVDRFAFDVELCYLADQLNYRVLELPVIWRNGSHSSVRALEDSITVFLDIFRIRLNHARGIYR